MWVTYYVYSLYMALVYAGFGTLTGVKLEVGRIGGNLIRTSLVTVFAVLNVL